MTRSAGTKIRWTRTPGVVSRSLYTTVGKTTAYYRDPIMNVIQKRQQGASAIAIIIILALIGAGVFFGLQYIPHFIEEGTVDTILDNIATTHKETPFYNVKGVEEAVKKRFELNQIEGLANNIKVTETGDAYVIKVHYERDLNLLYKKTTMQYDKSLTLKR